MMSSNASKARSKRSNGPMAFVTNDFDHFGVYRLLTSLRKVADFV
jgi:hypothetical protein